MAIVEETRSDRGSAVRAVLLTGDELPTLVVMRVDSDGNAIDSSTVTLQPAAFERGAVAAGALAANPTWTEVLVPSSALFSLTIKQTFNQPIEVSFDGGTTIARTFEVREPGEVFPFAEAGLSMAGTVSVRPVSTTPTTGRVEAGGMRA